MEFNTLLLCLGGILVTLLPGIRTVTECDEVVQRDEKQRPVSCMPCNVGDYEIHVISVSVSTPRPIRIEMSQQEGTPLRPVKLVLMSEFPVTWEISHSNLVFVEEILSVSPTAPKVNIPPHGHYPRKYHEERNIDDMTKNTSLSLLQTFVKNKLGRITSYQADYSRQPDFRITVGVCDKDDPEMLTDEEIECLDAQRCLLKMDFEYDDEWTDCDGEQYVNSAPPLYVGIVLCSPNRYKLFLSNRLRGPYMNIADRVLSEDRVDHCELLGMENERNANNSFGECPSNLGFFRMHNDEDFSFGRICGKYHSAVPETTSTYSPKWYTCGNIRIPGTFKIIEMINEEAPTSQSKVGLRPLVPLVAPLGSVAGVILLFIIIVLMLVRRRRRRITRRESSAVLVRPSSGIYSTVYEGACRPPLDLPPPTPISSRDGAPLSDIPCISSGPMIQRSEPNVFTIPAVSDGPESPADTFSLTCTKLNSPSWSNTSSSPSSPTSPDSQTMLLTPHPLMSLKSTMKNTPKETVSTTQQEDRPGMMDDVQKDTTYGEDRPLVQSQWKAAASVYDNVTLRDGGFVLEDKLYCDRVIIPDEK